MYMGNLRPQDTRRAAWLAGVGLAACLFLGASTYAQDAKAPAKSEAPEVSPRLADVKRICVQGFGGDALGYQAQEALIAKLFEAKRFSITENCEKADFVLKGSVVERAETVHRSESESIGFGQGASGSSSSSSSIGGVRSSNSSSGSARVSGGASEALSSTETKQSAAVTLRIVDRDGEVIWATSQETGEGKAKSAVGLAAEMAVRRLLRDIDRASRDRPTPK